jgi:YihY family inner membrane protein
MAVRVAPGSDALREHRRHRRSATHRERAAHLTRRVGRGALARWDREQARLLHRTAPGRFLRWLYCGYQEVNAGDLAAAIAYHALIALVPIFLGVVSLAGFFLQRQDVLQTAIFAAVWALPFEEARQTLEALLGARQNRGWFGLLSLVGFFLVAVGFVNGLARGMNRVYGVPNRHFIHQRLRSFAIVVIFAVLFVIAAFALTLPSLFVKQDVGAYFETWRLASTEGQTVSYLVGVSAAGLLFLLLYRLLPNAGQRLADVWPGSLVAAALFGALAQAFPLYIRFNPSTDRLALAFGIGTLVVLWFYVLAHALLFGTYVNATYQRHRLPHPPTPSPVQGRGGDGGDEVAGGWSSGRGSGGRAGRRVRPTMRPAAPAAMRAKLSQ